MIGLAYAASRPDAAATDVANLTERAIGARGTSDVVAVVRILVARLTCLTGQRALRAAPLRELAEFQAVAKQTVIAVGSVRAVADDTSASHLETNLTTRTFQFDVAAGQIVACIRRAVVAVIAICVNHTFHVLASVQHLLTDLIFVARQRSGAAGARHEIARLHAITKNSIVAMRMDGAFAVLTDS